MDGMEWKDDAMRYAALMNERFSSSVCMIRIDGRKQCSDNWA